MLALISIVTGTHTVMHTHAFLITRERERELVHTQLKGKTTLVDILVVWSNVVPVITNNSKYALRLCSMLKQLSKSLF